MKKENDSTLIHIRVGKEIRKQIERLIQVGLFSNQSELAREAIRDLLLKYSDQSKKIDQQSKNEKDK